MLAILATPKGAIKILKILSSILGSLATASVANWLEVSERHRELDQPREAQSALNRAGGLVKDRVAIWQKMIDEGFTGPMRYRL